MGHDDAMVIATRRVGWAVSSTSVGLVGLWLVLGGPARLGQHGPRAFLENEYGNIVFALLFPLVGALILDQTPRHRLGWLYCLSGLASATTLAAAVYAQQGLVDRPGSLPGALAVAWVSSWIWMCGFSPLVTLGLLGFPDGRLPSRRWWPVAAGAFLTLGLGVAGIALRPGPLENHPARDNPLGLPLPRSWFDTVLQGGWLSTLTVTILASFTAMVMRYRRAPAAERDQHRWFVLSGALLIASFAAPAGLIGNLLIVVAVPLLPLSVGLSVLRARLGDAGGAWRRSLVYGWLLALELALYAAVVGGLDTVLRGRAAPFTALLGAGAVAVLYQPLQVRLRRSTDRLLYGDRGDPYAVVTGLGRHLEAAGSAEAALPATVTAVAEALCLPFVAIALAGDLPQQPSTAHGTWPQDPPVRFPLSHGGRNVGALLVGRRHPREDLTPAEHALLGDLAVQIAGATHAVLLERDLRRSRDQLLVAQEQERQRLRRDLHDGLGPALAGVALGVDAARNLVRMNSHGADDLLRELKNETLGCVSEVRRIVEDLQPPALDELGLLQALTLFADRLSHRHPTLRTIVDVPRALPDLPPMVKAAIYRITTEAMTNVARHAGARCCRVRIEVTDQVVVQVCDDGIGLPQPRHDGIGVPSMAERAAQLGGWCSVGPAAGGGTVVLAHLPLGPQ